MRFSWGELLKLRCWVGIIHIKEGEEAFPAKGITSSKRLCGRSVSPHPLLPFASYLTLLPFITSWGQDGYHSPGHSSQERGKKGQLALSAPLIRNRRLFQKLPSRLPLYFIGKILIPRLVTDKAEWDNMIGLNQCNFFFDTKVKYEFPEHLCFPEQRRSGNRSIWPRNCSSHSCGIESRLRVILRKSQGLGSSTLLPQGLRMQDLLVEQAATWAGVLCV